MPRISGAMSAIRSGAVRGRNKKELIKGLSNIKKTRAKVAEKAALDKKRANRRVIRRRGGKSFEVGPGDCVATGMGHHHDFPHVSEPIRAIYFETTLEGEKRRGHLWDHKHGAAQPQTSRA